MSRPTEADKNDPGVPTPVLLEFSDKVSQALVERISGISEIANAEKKVVLELGAIENETRTLTQDFRQVRNRIQSKLVNSDILQEYADVMDRPELTQKELDRLVSKEVDLLDRNRGGASGVAEYDPAVTYILNGYFGEQIRGQGAKSAYYFRFTLTHLGSRRMVFSEDYDLVQQRN